MFIYFAEKYLDMDEELYKYHKILEVPKDLADNLFQDLSNEPEEILLEKMAFIKNIAKVNIITGVNNSGKSLFIRNLVKYHYSKDLHLDTRKLFSEKISVELNRVTELLSKTKILGGAITNETVRNIYLQPLKTEYEAHLISFLRKSIEEIIGKIEYNRTYRSFNEENQKYIIESIWDGFYYLESVFIQLNKKVRFQDTPPIYIPTVRSLRTFFKDNDKKTFFFDKTKEEYKFNNTFIENGENFYHTIFKWNNSEKQYREKVEDYANFLRDNFFYDEVDFITDYENNVLRIKIGNEKDESIHNLGDGLQMLIILTFPLFNYESGIIAIEEPELFIHPGLQKKLIDIYLNHERSKNFIFFIATHSNHIMDVSNNSDKASLFSMRKFIKSKDKHIYPDFILRNITYGDEHVLNQLGITNTSVYLANCSIWVEGVTEILYLRKYIRCYLSNENLELKPEYSKCLNFQEGIAYSFVISGGDNIIHFDFTGEYDFSNIESKVKVKYLCGKAMVIVDNDNDKNIGRKNKLVEELGMSFKVLDVIEIENLLPLEAIIEAVKSYPTWQHINTDSLIEKIKIASKEEYKDFRKELRIGSFIDDVLLKDESDLAKRTKSFKKDNRDIKEGGSTLRPNDKVKFCEKAIDFVTFNNMTPESKLLVENILDFILLKNPSFK